MGMITAYKNLWLNYFNFKGRASRGDYWWAFLANFIVGIIIGIVSGNIRVDFISTLYSIAIFIPWFALTTRRMHDVNKTIWQVIAPFVLAFAGTGLIVYDIYKSIGMESFKKIFELSTSLSENSINAMAFRNEIEEIFAPYTNGGTLYWVGVIMNLLAFIAAIWLLVLLLTPTKSPKGRYDYN